MLNIMLRGMKFEYRGYEVEIMRAERWERNVLESKWFSWSISHDGMVHHKKINGLAKDDGSMKSLAVLLKSFIDLECVVIGGSLMHLKEKSFCNEGVNENEQGTVEESCGHKND